MLVLVDNNFAQREGMREYLAASPDNRAAISHTLMEEWHKRNAAGTARKLLRIACSFPRQIVLLKDTAELMHMHGRPHGLLLRLIDRGQTRDFGAYCDTVINAPLSKAIEARFAAHEDDVRQRMAELTGQAHKMMEVFAGWDDPQSEGGFTPGELSEMRGIVARGERLSPELQYKTFLKAAEQAAAQFRRHGVDWRSAPRDLPEMANLLAFRYGAMMVGLYVFWRNRPGTYPGSDKTALNWLNDLKIAAQATISTASGREKSASSRFTKSVSASLRRSAAIPIAAATRRSTNGWHAAPEPRSAGWKPICTGTICIGRSRRRRLGFLPQHLSRWIANARQSLPMSRVVSPPSASSPYAPPLPGNECEI